MKFSDSNRLFQIWSDPKVTKYMNISNLTDETQAQKMILLLENLAKQNKAIRYSIIELKVNKIIGSCGYNSIDFENSKTEIGYEIDKNYWGNGYAPEAITGLIDYAFSDLKLNRIEAKVEPENINSIKTLERLKFTFEGTQRKVEKSKGRFIDLNLYSLLVTD
jgi:ribosomal-protein-alanine N-acetyltransferase